LMVRQKEGHLLNAFDFAPSITNRTCINSRPMCLHKTMGPEGALAPASDFGFNVSSTCQAGYSYPCRLQSAMLPQGRPLISTNQSFQASFRSISIINKPRQPEFRIIASELCFNAPLTGSDSQALDPDPCGFIIRTL